MAKVLHGTPGMAKRHSVRPESGLMIIGRRIGGFALNGGESDVGQVGQVRRVRQIS